MIIGIGIDQVSIKRIEKLIEKPGFVTRVFTPAERELAESRTSTAQTYAKRFAAKEAFVKAMRTNEDGISWQDMEILNEGAGAPVMTVSGKAHDVLVSKLNPNQAYKIHVSLTDTDTDAGAMVVVEGV